MYFVLGSWEAHISARELQAMPELLPHYRSGLARGIELQEKHLPHVELDILPPGYTSCAGYTENSETGARRDYVRWNMDQGIEALLHEMGHHLCGHVRPELTPDRVSQLTRCNVEREAWEKAEELALAEGLTFRYTEAEECFRSYKKFGRWYIRPLCIRWKHKGTEAENHGPVLVERRGDIEA